MKWSYHPDHIWYDYDITSSDMIIYIIIGWNMLNNIRSDPTKFGQLKQWIAARAIGAFSACCDGDGNIWILLDLFPSFLPRLTPSGSTCSWSRRACTSAAPSCTAFWPPASARTGPGSRARTPAGSAQSTSRPSCPKRPLPRRRATTAPRKRNDQTTPTNIHIDYKCTGNSNRIWRRGVGTIRCLCKKVQCTEAKLVMQCMHLFKLILYVQYIVILTVHAGCFIRDTAKFVW